MKIVKSLPAYYRFEKQAGFTLIELLVVIMIMLSIGGIVSGIFVVSLRSANKTNQTTVVRQNGNAALTHVIRRLRYAREFVGISTSASGTYNSTCTTTGNYIRVNNTDTTGANISTTIYCPANTALGTNDPIRVTTGATTVDLTDVNVAKVKGCQLSCVRQTSNSVTINIRYDMVDKNESTGLFENTVQPIRFDTTVTLRNSQ